MPVMPSHGARMDQLAGRLPLATPMRPERKAEELRHAVTFESTSLVAELLLVRRTRSLKPCRTSGVHTSPPPIGWRPLDA